MTLEFDTAARCAASETEADLVDTTGGRGQGFLLLAKSVPDQVCCLSSLIRLLRDDVLKFRLTLTFWAMVYMTNHSICFLKIAN